MAITAEELYNKSRQQQVTHRKRWADLEPTRRFEYEAWAEWANELFSEQEKGLRDLLMRVNSKATWVSNRFRLPDGCSEEINEIIRLTDKFRNG